MPRFGSKRSRGIRSNVKVDNLKRNVLGIAQNQAESFLRPEQAIDIVNMHATEEGSWSADDVGYDVINAGGTAFESGAAIAGMGWFVDSAFDEHLFISLNGKIGEVDTGTGEYTERDGAAGFTVGNPVDFEGMKDMLFSVDGSVDAPRKWNGAAASDAGGWPVSDGTNEYKKPKYIGQYQGRAVFMNLQGGTDTWPSHFIISRYDEPEDFSLDVGASSAYIGECRPGDGQQIVGGAAIFEPLSNRERFVIFKDNSTYVVTGSSGKAGDPDEIRVDRVNGAFGALNNKCIIELGNDIIALDRYGLTSYTSVSNSGAIQPNALNSDLIRDTIASINMNAADKCWGEHLPHRREVVFHIPVAGSGFCNAAIVYKYPAPGSRELPKWSRRTDAGGKFNLSAGVLAGTTFYVGTSDGLVGTMFTSSTYNGTGIPYVYKYPHMALKNEEQIGRVLHGFAHFKVRSNQTANMQARWLGGGNGDVTNCPLALQTTVSGDVYGTVVLGAGYYGAAEEIKAMFEPLGDGNRLQLILSGTTDETGPEFLGVTLVREAGGLVRHWN